MTHYSIDVDTYSLTQGINTAEEFLDYREANRDVTCVFWLITGVEIDLTADNCTYYHHTPVLIFLN
jgi:hypothetical protein